MKREESNKLNSKRLVKRPTKRIGRGLERLEGRALMAIDAGFVADLGIDTEQPLPPDVMYQTGLVDGYEVPFAYTSNDAAVDAPVSRVYFGVDIATGSPVVVGVSDLEDGTAEIAFRLEVDFNVQYAAIHGDRAYFAGTGVTHWDYNEAGIMPLLAVREDGSLAPAGDPWESAGDQGVSVTSQSSVYRDSLSLPVWASWRSKVASVDLTKGQLIDEVDVEGMISNLHVTEAGQLIVVSSGTPWMWAMPQIGFADVSPWDVAATPGNSLVTDAPSDLIFPSFHYFQTSAPKISLFTSDANGLTEVSSVSVPEGIIKFVGDDVLVFAHSYGDIRVMMTAETNLLVKPIGDDVSLVPEFGQSIYRYTVVTKDGAPQLIETGHDELLSSVPGYVSEPYIYGDRAYVVTTDIVDGVANQTVTVVDLTGGQVKSIDSFTLPAEYAFYIAGADGRMFFGSYNEGSTLIVVDVRASERSVAEFALPLGVRFDQIHTVTDDNWVVFGGSTMFQPFDVALRPIEESPDSKAINIPWDSSFYVPVYGQYRLSLESGEAGRIEGLSGDSYATVIPLDATRDLFAFVRYNPESDSGYTMAWGQFGGEAGFTVWGEVNTGMAWPQVSVYQDQLLLQTTSQLIAYSLDGRQAGGLQTEPLYTLRLGGEAVPVQALDDSFTVFDSDQEFSLDLLANDTWSLWSGLPVRVAELIDAPAGIELVNGMTVVVDGSVNPGVYEFQYRLTDGETESVAAVRVEVVDADSPQVKEAIQKVRQRAAQDWSVTVDDVEVVNVRGPDPTIVGYLPRIWNYGQYLMLMTVKIHQGNAGRVAEYGVTNDGQIDSLSKQALVDVQTRVVDADGNLVTDVASGDSVWIEVLLDDLRPLGSGVFAAFVNLEVPNDLLVLDPSSLEYGSTFSPPPTAVVTETSLDGVGGIGDPDRKDGEPQLLLRIKATATGTGAAVLAAIPAKGIGQDILIYDRNEALISNEVLSSGAVLNIGESLGANVEDSMDIDGDGKLFARDALMVINFLTSRGIGTLERLMAEAGSAGQGSSVTDMAKYDVNGDLSVTPLDALLVINRLNRVNADQLFSSMVGDTKDTNSILPGTEDLVTWKRKRT